MSVLAQNNPVAKRAREYSRARTLLSIATYGAALAALLPVVSIIVIALTTRDDSIAHMLGTVLPAALRDTFLLLAGVAIMTALIGTTAAWLVTAHDFPGRRALSWLLVLPLAMPTYIAAYIAVELFEPLGPVQQTFRWLTGYASARDYWFPSVRTLPGAIISFSLVLYPYVYLSARAMMMTQSASPLDAARVLGATPARAVREVALPLARPAIVAGLTLALLETLNDIGASEYLGVRTLALSIYTTWLNRHSLPGAAQIACVLLLFVALIVFAEIYWRGARAYMNSAKRPQPLYATPLHGWKKWAACLFCALPVLAGFVLPVLFLIRQAYLVLRREGIPDGLVSQIGATLIYAAIATLFIVLIGIAVALAVRRTRRRSVRVAATVATFGYALPGTVLALGLLWPLAWLDQTISAFLRHMLNTNATLLLIGSGLALAIAMSIRFMSIGINGISSGLARLPHSLEESARTMGASDREILHRIQWPLMKPALAAAALIALIDTAKELPATLLLRPLGVETLATTLYENAARGQFEDGTVQALLLVLIGLAAALYLAAASHRPQR
ncbi:MAG: ABC transporter permease [Beijerinckiaceae bacterium]